MYSLLSRRKILSSALASSSIGLAVQYPALTFAQSATPTPECHDGDKATIRQTEGPYFKPSSPQRADLIEPGATGQLVEVTGHVLTRSCRPVERALLDLWHADEQGEYDNAGLPLSRTHLYRWGGSLSVPHNPAGPLSRPYPSLSRQSAGSGAAGAHDAALFCR